MPSTAYTVTLNRKRIDTVYSTDKDPESVRRSLINHDGYDSGIRVSRERAKRARVVKTIEVPPQWVGLLPALLALIEDGTPTGRKQALAELRRMAQAADFAGTLTASVLEWAKTPQDHGGNPYTKPFVKLAMRTE